MSTQWMDDIERCPRCKTSADWSFGALTICRSCGMQWKPAAHEAKRVAKADRRRVA